MSAQVKSDPLPRPFPTRRPSHEQRPKTRSNRLSESAQLTDLSSDVRLIHGAMLPERVQNQIQAFNQAQQPTLDQAKQCVALILDHCPSVVDALLACRQIEGSLGLAVHRATDRDEAEAFDQQVRQIFLILSGNLNLGSLTAIQEADRIGRIRGLARSYRMERLALGEGEKPAPSSEEAKHAGSKGQQTPSRPPAPWRWWLSNPVGLPRRRRDVWALSLGLVVIPPVLAGLYSAITPAPPQAWAWVIGAMVVLASVTILLSPYRWPAHRQAPHPAAQEHAAHATRATAMAGDEKNTAPAGPMDPQQAGSDVLHWHEERLTKQGVNVSAMDDVALTAWIEQSGVEIATYLQAARNQSENSTLFIPTS